MPLCHYSPSELLQYHHRDSHTASNYHMTERNRIQRPPSYFVRATSFILRLQGFSLSRGLSSSGSIVHLQGRDQLYGSSWPTAVHWPSHVCLTASSFLWLSPVSFMCKQGQLGTWVGSAIRCTSFFVYYMSYIDIHSWYCSNLEQLLWYCGVGLKEKWQTDSYCRQVVA